jgi:predicted TIM-barrel enzyme
MPEAPIFVGSGSTQENVKELLSVADGIIVGTTLKRRGQLEQPVDVDRVREFVSVVKATR